MRVKIGSTSLRNDGGEAVSAASERTPASSTRKLPNVAVMRGTRDLSGGWAVAGSRWRRTGSACGSSLEGYLPAFVRTSRNLAPSAARLLGRGRGGRRSDGVDRRVADALEGL